MSEEESRLIHTNLLHNKDMSFKQCYKKFYPNVSHILAILEQQKIAHTLKKGG